MNGVDLTILWGLHPRRLTSVPNKIIELINFFFFGDYKKLLPQHIWDLSLNAVARYG